MYNTDGCLAVLVPDWIGDLVMIPRLPPQVITGTFSLHVNYDLNTYFGNRLYNDTVN